MPEYELKPRLRRGGSVRGAEDTQAFNPPHHPNLRAVLLVMMLRAAQESEAPVVALSRWPPP
eukprot:9747561-Alexandrium_andersonii.AAC.1